MGCPCPRVPPAPCLGRCCWQPPSPRSLAGSWSQVSGPRYQQPQSRRVAQAWKEFAVFLPSSPSLQLKLHWVAGIFSCLCTAPGTARRPACLALAASLPLSYSARENLEGTWRPPVTWLPTARDPQPPGSNLRCLLEGRDPASTHFSHLLGF